MQPEILSIRLSLEEGQDPAAIRRETARVLAVAESALGEVRVRRRSLDSRPRPPVWQLAVEHLAEGAFAQEAPLRPRPAPEGAERVLVVGTGPAGYFAALELLERGFRPVLFERGRRVRERRRDIAAVQREARVDPDGNYGFGEGGAGTYSDGKLYTRAHKRGDVRRVLHWLVSFGATPEILVEAHPHIGSNRLPRVVTALREGLERAGAELHFDSRVTALLRDGKGRLAGLRCADGREFAGQRVVLATGHSARDVHAFLKQEGLRLEAKAFALGLRIEHPQEAIDRMQYGKDYAHPLLPAASYSLATTVRGRGVFSFCMCPGGFIVPAATAPGELVVNGMSLARRASPYANSGMVVAVEPEDLPGDPADPFIGQRWQAAIEKRAWELGGKTQVAPAQRLQDFLAGRVSQDLPACSYHPGLASVDMAELLPPFILERLQKGLAEFCRKHPLYDNRDAVLVGVESRTSSPVRIPRGKDLRHPDLPGLYPCGEGAGFAGGIVSAALDGMRVAEAIGGS